MNFFTRIVVDKKTAKSRELENSYTWHKAVWEAFPNKWSDERDFLIRVNNRGSFLEILLLSKKRPTFPGWGRWETRAINPNFLGYERYRFNLRANPTVKRVVRYGSGDRKKNGRRNAIRKREELIRWLAKKGKASGFEVEQLEMHPPIVQPFKRNGRKGNHVRVDFEGVLRVEDATAFKTAFSNGIGPAKAFGFGMLVLKPLK